MRGVLGKRIWVWFIMVCLVWAAWGCQAETGISRPYASEGMDGGNAESVPGVEGRFTLRDFDTGEFVTGVHLKILLAEEKDGIFVPSAQKAAAVLSEKEPELLAELTPGERYFLIEEHPAFGRIPAVPVLFTVSENGKIETVQNHGRTILFGGGEVAFSLRTASAVRYTLHEGGRDLMCWEKGEEADSEEAEMEEAWAETGELWESEETQGSRMFTLCEQTLFSDGTAVHTGWKTFCIPGDEVREIENWSGLGRSPVRTELVLRDEMGRAVPYEVYDVISGNEAETDCLWGRFLVRQGVGEVFYLEETTYYNDGTSFLTAREQICVDENGNARELALQSRTTKLVVWRTPGEEKADLAGESQSENADSAGAFEDETENPAGASWQLTDRSGKKVMQWTAKKTPVELLGSLKAGEQYRVAEKTPSAGLSYSVPVSFTVSGDEAVTEVLLANLAEPGNLDEGKTSVQRAAEWIWGEAGLASAALSEREREDEAASNSALFEELSEETENAQDNLLSPGDFDEERGDSESAGFTLDPEEDNTPQQKTESAELSGLFEAQDPGVSDGFWRGQWGGWGSAEISGHVPFPSLGLVLGPDFPVELAAPVEIPEKETTEEAGGPETSVSNISEVPQSDPEEEERIHISDRMAESAMEFLDTLPLPEHVTQEAKQAVKWVRRHMTVIYLGDGFFLCISLFALFLLVMRRERKRGGGKV